MGAGERPVDDVASEEEGEPIDRWTDLLPEGAREEWDRYTSAAGALIRERPLAAVAGALLLGYLVGRIASRR